jgi:hypothetical protein
VQGFTMGSGVQGLDRRDELSGGFAGPPASIVDRYAPAGSLRSRAYVNDLFFFLPLCGLGITITPGGAGVTDLAGVNVPAGAYKATLQPVTATTPIPQTAELTACYVPASTFTRTQGVGISRFGMSAEGDWTADLVGLVYGTISDPNYTPSWDSSAIPPLLAANFSVSAWLSGAGEATKEGFGFEIANPIEPYSGAGSASYYPSDLQVGEDVVVMTGTRTARYLTDADIDALVALQTFAARMKWQSPVNVAASGTPYRMLVDVPAAQYVGGDADELAHKRRFGGSWNWQATVDPTAGYAFKIDLVGSIAAVATYV